MRARNALDMCLVLAERLRPGRMGVETMANVTRRSAIKISTGAAVTGDAAISVANAPASLAQNTQGGRDMGIERYDLTPSIPGIPLISYAVAHGGIVYLSGITANPANLGDVKDQTHRSLPASIHCWRKRARTNPRF